MKPIPFLSKVWEKVCEPGDYVFLSIKHPRWKDFYFRYDSSLKGRVRDWLRQNDAKDLDIYFCPLPFSKPERLAKYVKPVNILWSDVDDGDPKKLRPTVLWESSPGRHHALWFLKNKLNAEDASHLNKSLTYHLGADKGGWDLSQVLRVPGTYNHKYKSKPQVKLKHWDSKELNHRVIARKVKHRIAPTVRKTESNILDKYSVPNKVLQLLHGEAEEGRRSDVLWYLENKLSEIGLHPEEVIQVLKDSDWNKYKGRADEDARLKTEVSKVVEKNIKEKEEKKVRKKESEDYLQFETFEEVMSSLDSGPSWAIPGFWMNRSHGIVAGQPKSFKSTLVMDLALSIATGKPFLGKYPVETTGPVIYIQNENSSRIMRDRFEKMIHSKNAGGSVSTDPLSVQFPEQIHFHMLNQKSFMLSSEDHQEIIEEKIAEIKPQLVIFDPLYLMFDGDLASARDLMPLLQWLLYLKNEYKCGVLLVHHYNKGSESSRGGQRMLGSTTLHGWVESGWYISTDGDGSLEMEREFRGAGLHKRLNVGIEMGDFGDPLYKVTVGEKEEEKDPKETLQDDILAVLSNVRFLWEDDIPKKIGSSKVKVRMAINQMIDQGLCSRLRGKIKKEKS